MTKLEQELGIKDPPKGFKCRPLGRLKWDKNLGITVRLAKKANWSREKWCYNYRKIGLKGLTAALKLLLA